MVSNLAVRTTPENVIPTPDSILTRPMMALVAAWTLTCTVLVFFVAYLIRRNYPGCHHPNCMDAASDLQHIMDAQADPCDDFFRFVCGNFESAYPKAASYLDVITLRMKEAYREMLESYSTSPEDDVIETTVVAFRRCMQEYHDQLEHLTPLQRLDDDIGVLWQGIHPEDVEVDLLNFLMTLSLTHGVPVLLRVSVTQNVKSPGSNVLQLDAENIEEPFGRWVTRDVVTAVARNLSWVVAKSLSKEIFNTAQDIAALLRKSSQEPRKPEFVSINNVSNVFTHVTPQKFMDIANRLLPSTDFNNTGEFFTTSLEGLRQLSALMNNVDTRRLIYTIRFILIDKFMPISTFKIAQIYKRSPSAAHKLRQSQDPSEV